MLQLDRMSRKWKGLTPSASVRKEKGNVGYKVSHSHTHSLTLSRWRVAHPIIPPTPIERMAGSLRALLPSG